jgi:hypothetical protein
MAPFNLLVKLQQPVVSGFGRVDGLPVFVTNGTRVPGPAGSGGRAAAGHRDGPGQQLEHQDP